MSESKGGCFKYFAIGCLGFILLGSVGSYLTYRYVVNHSEELLASTIGYGVKAMISTMGLKKEDEDGLKKEVDTFVTEIGEGDISLEDGGNILAEITKNKSLMYVMLAQGLKEQGLQQHIFEEIEEAEIQKTVSRFCYGVLNNKISLEDIKRAEGLYSGFNNKSEKEKIKIEEFRELISLMKKCADKSNIENKLMPVQLVNAFRNELENSKKAVLLRKNEEVLKLENE